MFFFTPFLICCWAHSFYIFWMKKEEWTAFPSVNNIFQDYSTYYSLSENQHSSRSVYRLLGLKGLKYFTIPKGTCQFQKVPRSTKKYLKVPFLICMKILVKLGKNQFGWVKTNDGLGSQLHSLVRFLGAWEPVRSGS